MLFESGKRGAAIIIDCIGKKVGEMEVRGKQTVFRRNVNKKFPRQNCLVVTC